MTLRAGENAEIEPAKVRAYVFSEGHPGGRFKTVLFAAPGSVVADWLGDP